MCQALACGALLAIAAVPARPQGEASSAAGKTGGQAFRLEADGVTFEEPCAPAPGANAYTACGALAREAADVVRRLTPILGACPRKRIEIVVKAPHPEDHGPLVTGFSPFGIGIPEGVARAADDPRFFAAVMPFEVARQWFPSAEADAALKNPGMVEVLSQYLAWRYLLEANPEAARAMVAEAMRDSVAQWRTAALAEVIESFPSPGGAPRAALDQRGLLVLRTLETVIDRERVDRVIPLFIRRFGGHSSRVADFQRVCEEVAGRKLGWFFHYFFEGTRVPEIELKRLPAESPDVAAGEIVVKGLPEEGSVRVEMTVRTAQGLVQHSVATRGEVTPFTVNVPAPAMGITLDPDLRILRWTPAAERWKEQQAILEALPEAVTRENLPATIEIYRRALAADAENASLGAQSLHERLGELEYAQGNSRGALADLEAAINGHSIGEYETYLRRAKAYLYHGEVELHEGRPREAQADVQAAMELPRVVLAQSVPERPIESRGEKTLRQLLEILSHAATHY